MTSTEKKIVLITGKGLLSWIFSSVYNNIQCAGGNQGVGYETAKNLVLYSQDYHVILGSRDASKGESAAEELQSTSGVKGTVSFTQIDVTDDQSVDAVASRIATEYGRLGVLVNNAGIVSGQ